MAVKKSTLALLLLTIITTITFTSCGAKKRARRENSRKLHALTIEDFYSFIGVNKGDTYDKAVELWGDPGKEDRNDGTRLTYSSIYYYGIYGEKIFSLTYDKRNFTLNYIKLTGSSEVNYETTRKFFKERGVADLKIQFLGMHRDSIVSVFGEPTRIRTSEYQYEQGPITVTFNCPDFSYGHCDEISVFWNYYYKKEN